MKDHKLSFEDHLRSVKISDWRMLAPLAIEAAIVLLPFLIVSGAFW